MTGAMKKLADLSDRPVHRLLGPSTALIVEDVCGTDTMPRSSFPTVLGRTSSYRPSN